MCKNESGKTACGSSVNIPLTLLSFYVGHAAGCVSRTRTNDGANLPLCSTLRGKAKEIRLNGNRRGKAVAKHSKTGVNN